MVYRVLDIRGKTEEEYLQAYSRLPKYRRDRADKFRKISQRYESVFAFDLLLSMLSEATSKAYSELQIETTQKGKPYLKDYPLEFSISHTEGFVTCVVSNTPVGIDIETKQDVSGRVMERVLRGEELPYVLGNRGVKDAEKGSEASNRFLKIWTAKEAYLKFTGEGLSGLLKANLCIENGNLKLKDSKAQLLTEETEEYFLAIVKAGSD